MANKLRDAIFALQQGWKIDGVDIEAGAVTASNLASAIEPSHVVKYAGKHSYAGGATSSAATVTGVASTDVVVATIEASTNAVSVVKAVPTTNTVTLHFSADPGAATVISYVVFRAV